jgi:hypothetical protein
MNRDSVREAFESINTFAKDYEYWADENIYFGIDVQNKWAGFQMGFNSCEESKQKEIDRLKSDAERMSQTLALANSTNSDLFLQRGQLQAEVEALKAGQEWISVETPPEYQGRVGGDCFTPVLMSDGIATHSGLYINGEFKPANDCTLLPITHWRHDLEPPKAGE